MKINIPPRISKTEGVSQGTVGRHSNPQPDAAAKTVGGRGPSAVVRASSSRRECRRVNKAAHPAARFRHPVQSINPVHCLMGIIIDIDTGAVFIQNVVMKSITLSHGGFYYFFSIIIGFYTLLMAHPANCESLEKLHGR